MRGYVPIWSLSSNFPRAAALTENALLCCLASMFKLLHKHWEEDVNLSFHKKSNFDLKDIVTNVLSGKWLQIWYTYLWILISDLLILGMLALWTSSSGFIKIKLYKIPRYVFKARHDFIMSVEMKQIPSTWIVMGWEKMTLTVTRISVHTWENLRYDYPR